MNQPVTEADFAAEVLAAPEPVLVDFWAEWCPPCKALHPTLDAVAAELHGRVKLVSLDVGAHPAIAARYNVRNMPTMLVFKNGEPADIKVGAGQSRVGLVKWLEGHCG